MKKLLIASAAVLASAITLSAQQPSREHRSLWMSPYLSGNWPSSAITTSNAAAHQNILKSRLNKFKDQNINVVYYHVRTMCDAMYESSYEPWSSTVSGTRGVAPAFDPFGFLVEQAHQRGIEVYAWVNPYRYCSSKLWGDGELNYENSHPDWLIQQSSESILNPGKEEVKQRIVDVISEIVTKYDVDGIIFDDYFYTSSTPMSLDADLYAQYTAGGGTLSQADWRRANVNEMVHRVHDAIKKIKPYVAFGISPAGVASPSNVTSEYGLTAAPGTDWQYNGIYSDPLAWLKAGDIDYISPQIYWPSKYDDLSAWWSVAAKKFNRHFYPSVTLSDLSNVKSAEFIREIEQARSVNDSDCSGMVFFQYSEFVNYYENLFGKNQSFGDNMRDGAYKYKALTPLRPWNNSVSPVMTSNVKLDGTTLSWDEVQGARYTVYAIPDGVSDAQFSCQRQYLDGVTYDTSYTISSDMASGYRWAVAVYDRYGNEYSPLEVGKTATTTAKPALTYPANGASPVDLFDFTWTSDATTYIVEVARDKDFTDMVGSIQTDQPTASVTVLPTLEDGKTYYWRVRASKLNALESVSDVYSFVAARIKITSPTASATSVSLTPTIKWTAAVNSATYTLELSRQSDFSEISYTTEVTGTSATVPERTLVSGRPYYARVTATKGDVSSTSDAVTFSTLDRTDYAAPKFVNPSSSGVVLYSNDKIQIEPWEGMYNVTINIATSESFPSRSSYSGTLSSFATETAELSNIKISSKNLVDGTTYYVRARGSYFLNGVTANQYTDYSTVMSFVYSSAAGVGSVTSDQADKSFIDSADVLHLSKDAVSYEVYTLAGQSVMNRSVQGGESYSLSTLAPGAYIVVVKEGKTTTLKLIKH